MQIPYFVSTKAFKICFYTFLVLALIVAGIIVIDTFARQSQDGGEVSAAFDGNSNLNIASASDFDTFRTMVNNGTTFSGKTITQTADFTLSDSTIPVGTSSSRSFRGTYDGGRYEIRGFTGTSGSYQYYGLFGYVSGATIKNVCIKQANVDVSTKLTSTTYVGGVVGYAASSTITACSISGSSTFSVGAYGTIYVGGIVGYASSCTIEFCIVDIDMDVWAESNTAAYGYVSGIAYCSSTSSYVRYSIH